MAKEQLEAVKTDAQKADDFFNQVEAETDVKDFIKKMGVPREEIESPPDLFPPEEEEEETTEEPVDGGKGDTDDQMAEYLNYTEEHKYTAEFVLIQLDKILSFSFSLISGADASRYRRRQSKIQGEDYEAEIAAALVKKYQMRLSLEWMLASAIFIGYAPMFEKAMKDKRATAEQQNQKASVNEQGRTSNANNGGQRNGEKLSGS